MSSVGRVVYVGLRLFVVVSGDGPTEWCEDDQ